MEPGRPDPDLRWNGALGPLHAREHRRGTRGILLGQVVSLENQLSNGIKEKA